MSLYRVKYMRRISKGLYIAIGDALLFFFPVNKKG